MCAVGLQLMLGVDDPLDSSAVHLVNGVLGVILLAFVAKPQHVTLLTGSSCGGIFYARSGWLQLGMQVLGECNSLLKISGTTSAGRAKQA